MLVRILAAVWLACLAAPLSAALPGLVPEHQRIRSASLASPCDVPYDELSKDILHTREGVPVTSI